MKCQWQNLFKIKCLTGNYIRYTAINHNGKEYEKEYICTCKYHICVYINMLCCAQSLQLSDFKCLTLCNPMNCSLSPGSSKASILPCPSPGDLPHPGIKPVSLASPACRQILYSLSCLGSPCIYQYICIYPYICT